MVNMQHIGMLKLLQEDVKNMSNEGNEYYEEQWKRFRKSYDVKNKYHPIGQDYYFGDYKYEATQWHEKLLSKMHSTIKLEGRSDAKPRRNME